MAFTALTAGNRLSRKHDRLAGPKREPYVMVQATVVSGSPARIVTWRAVLGPVAGLAAMAHDDLAHKVLVDRGLFQHGFNGVRSDETAVNDPRAPWNFPIGNAQRMGDDDFG